MRMKETAISVARESLESSGDVDITALTRLKHADLWAAAKRLATSRYGGQSALARMLGVTPSEIGEWINLKACPPKAPTKAWPEQRLHKLECDLAEITGKTLEELFPDSLRNNEAFLSANKVHERTFTVEQVALAHYADATRERLKAAAHPRIEDSKPDIHSALSNAMGALTARERHVLELRYGLSGHDPMTMREVGRVMNITGGRVQQIESKAIRKLQRPCVARDELAAVIE